MLQPRVVTSIGSPRGATRNTRTVVPGSKPSSMMRRRNCRSPPTLSTATAAPIGASSRVTLKAVAQLKTVFKYGIPQFQCWIPKLAHHSCRFGLLGSQGMVQLGSVRCFAGCLATLLLTACGGKEAEPAPAPLVDAGPPRLELGYFYERTYDPFEPGDDLPVFHALQGGTWTMPALHFRGVVTPVRIEATLVTEAGERLGELDQEHSFSSELGGWVEIKRLPIPATHEPPNEDDPIDDLFGQTATLSMTVSDEAGNTASASAEVVIADRPIL